MSGDSAPLCRHVSDDPCLICAKEFKNDERALQCFLCDKWCHASCINITTKNFDIINKFYFMEYICNNCRNNLKKTP